MVLSIIGVYGNEDLWRSFASSKTNILLKQVKAAG